MKVWSNVSTIIKLAVSCLIAGFCFGVWASIVVGNVNEAPRPVPASANR